MKDKFLVSPYLNSRFPTPLTLSCIVESKLQEKKPEINVLNKGYPK